MPTAGLYGMGAGAILGGLQYGQQQRQYDTNMQLAAATARNSPWTGMRPNMPTAPSLMGNIVQGATSGGSMGAQVGQSSALTNYLNAGGNGPNAVAPAAMAASGSPSLGVNTSMGSAPSMSDFSPSGNPSPWSTMPSQNLPATGGAMDPMAVMAMQRQQGSPWSDGLGYYGRAPQQAGV